MDPSSDFGLCLKRTAFPLIEFCCFYSCFFFQSVSLGSPYIQLCFIFYLVYCGFGWQVVVAGIFLSYGSKMPVSIDTRTSYNLSRMSNCGGNISYIGKASHKSVQSMDPSQGRGWLEALNKPVFCAHLHFRHRNQLSLDVSSSLRVIKLHRLCCYKEAHHVHVTLAEVTWEQDSHLEGSTLIYLTVYCPEMLWGHDLPA